MKRILSCLALSIMLTPGISRRNIENHYSREKLPIAHNLIIVTTDGFRWQEIFTGADSSILFDQKQTPDTALMRMSYWDSDLQSRRKKLLPFFWNVIAEKGQLFGNRNYGNCFDVANQFACSYPGYNELLTGNTDVFINSNQKVENPNINVLEYINSLKEFNGKVCAFTSWELFPYILNTERNQLPLNTQSDEMNKLEEKMHEKKSATRSDLLTYAAARNYLTKERPRLLFLGLGETDEFAHQGRYDLYLQQASQVDGMISGLWNWIQTTPGYKDNTILMVTTDHGRGGKKKNWDSHGVFIKGSSQTWLAFLGPGIPPSGEQHLKRNYHLEQMARTIASVLGEEFLLDDPAPAIALQ